MEVRQSFIHFKLDLTFIPQTFNFFSAFHKVADLFKWTKHSFDKLSNEKSAKVETV